MGTCIFCEKPLDGSREHIIPSAIGGRIASTELVCSDHNNSLGGTIDRALAEQLSVISNLLKIRTGRRRDPPKIQNLTTTDGQKIELEPGGLIVLPRPTKELSKTENGTTEFVVSGDATKRDQLKMVVSGLLRGLRVNRTEVQHLRARVRSQRHEVNVGFTLGGVDQARAIAKMALLLFARTTSVAYAQEEPFRGIRDFVADSLGAPLDFIRYGLPFDGLAIPLGIPPTHHVVVSANPAKRAVIGLVEIYGAFRYSILLSEKWSRDPIAFAYSVTPVTGEAHDNGNIPPLEFSASDFRDQLNQKDMLQQGMERLWPYVNSRRNDLMLGRLSQGAIDTALGPSDGRVLTEEDINRLSRVAAEQFLYFQQGITHETEIDPEELVGWATKEAKDEES